MTDAVEEVLLDHLTREFFEPALGTHFEIPFEDGTSHQIELAETREVFAGGQKEGQRQPFALTFLGATDKYVQQATYPLVHPALGRMSFFLVPLGPDPKQGGRMKYEAIFT